MKITEIPKYTCSVCGYFIDAATSVTDKYRAPREGDITLCFGCGEVSMFDKNLEMRQLDADELSEIYNEDRSFQMQIALLQSAIRKLKPLRNEKQ